MKEKIEVLKADTEALQAKAFEIRQEVFVVEQKVSPEDEFDQFEKVASHFVALDQGLPVGAARWRTTSNGIKLERFAVKKAYRGTGIGSKLVQAVQNDILQNVEGDKYLYLHAQLTAIPLYEKFGFIKTGPQFEECNIQHFKMERILH
ncbi:MAG: GNAT family N-acetyltransferase [Cyclobacteriaceae bacterium]